MAIAGLDVGTSGCKCTVFEENGQISSYAYMSYDLILGKHGQLELNPDTVFEAVLLVIKKAKLNHKAGKINVLCISSFGEAGVLIDEKGKALYNSLLYADPRGVEQCEQMISKLGRWEITKKSGHNPAHIYSAPKLMWIRDNEKNIFDNAYKFLQYSGYILFKLSGEIKEEWSLSARTLMFNVVEKKWDDTLLDAANLDKKLFPETVKTGQPAGEISEAMAEETGLDKGTMIVLGGQDQITAALGGGALSAGLAVNGMGSVDCITPVFDHPIINKHMQEYSYGMVPYIFDDHYVTYAFSFGGGALMKWYKENFAFKEFSELEKAAPKDPTGILVLPHIMGAATPYMDPLATGAIVGLKVNTDIFTLYRAMMEGVAYEAKLNIDLLKEAGIAINRLTACGGGSRSKMWLQIKADVFDIPIDVLTETEAGTLGAAIMGGAASGAYKNIHDAAGSLVKVKETIYPNSTNKGYYIEIFEKYKRMYKKVKEIWRNEN